MSDTGQFSLPALWRRILPNKAELEALLDMLPQAALLVGLAEPRILAANDQALALSGFKRSELLSCKLASLLDGWESEPLRTESGFENNRVQRQDVELIRRDGSWLPVHLTTALLPSPNKLAVLTLEPVTGPSQDGVMVAAIFERLNEMLNAAQHSDLEVALTQALTAAQALFRSKLLAVYLADEDQPMLLRSAGCGAVELMPERLSPHELASLAAPDLWTPGKRAQTGLQRAARSARLAYLVSVPLGQPRALIGLLVIAGDPLPQCDHVLPTARLLSATLTNIIQGQTLTNRLETELEARDQVIAVGETLEETIGEGLLVLSPELLIDRLNQVAEMMLGYAGWEVAGQAVEMILIGTQGVLPALTAAQQGSPTYNLGNIRLYRRSGEEFLARVRTFPVLTAGRVEKILVLIEDLSEQELIRMHTQQLEQRAVLGEVTAIFAHEVRNPINNISTGLQLMALNLPENDPNQQAVQRLVQDCDRLADLMKSVLAFARPTNYAMEPLDLGGLVKRLVDRLRPRMTQANVVHQLQIDPDCPPALGNARALEQVFTNLINNAVQAMSDTGGNLLVRVQPVSAEDLEIAGDSPAYVTVSVADNGPGIDREAQERLFQPFYTTSRNGTGLGLPIAKRIVTAHRGTIHVTSVPGGTVFHVQIPVAVTPPPEVDPLSRSHEDT